MPIFISLLAILGQVFLRIPMEFANDVISRQQLARQNMATGPAFLDFGKPDVLF
jgi:hypothetical protein